MTTSLDKKVPRKVCKWTINGPQILWNFGLAEYSTLSNPTLSNPMWDGSYQIIITSVGESEVKPIPAQIKCTFAYVAFIEPQPL